MSNSIWFDHRQGELQHFGQSASRQQHFLPKSIFFIIKKIYIHNHPIILRQTQWQAKWLILMPFKRYQRSINMLPSGFMQIQVSCVIIINSHRISQVYLPQLWIFSVISWWRDRHFSPSCCRENKILSFLLNLRSVYTSRNYLYVNGVCICRKYCIY